MDAEFQHVSEGERLSWAFGCLIAAIKQRLVPMDTGDFRVSRFVMLIETLGCFGSLTMVQYEFTFGGSGLIRYNSEILQMVSRYQGGTYIFWMTVCGAVGGLVGPIGLFLGLRYVLVGRALANHTFGWSMIAATLGLYILGTVAGFLVGPPGFSIQPGFALLMVAMPAAGILHLMYLARPAAPAQIFATA